jgi:ribose 5-phosphate isomerase B
MKPLYIGADHAGFILKEFLKNRLNDAGISFVDVGPFSQDSVDYPDYASQVALAIKEGKAEQGILVCGSGQGMVMAANKIQGIRAGLAWNTEIAALMKEHNHAQVICLGARFTASDYAWLMVQAFLKAQPADGNHPRRVEKMNLLC